MGGYLPPGPYTISYIPSGTSEEAIEAQFHYFESRVQQLRNASKERIFLLLSNLCDVSQNQIAVDSDPTAQRFFDAFNSAAFAPYNISGTVLCQNFMGCIARMVTHQKMVSRW